jgi:hypothetical protein
VSVFVRGKGREGSLKGNLGRTGRIRWVLARAGDQLAAKGTGDPREEVCDKKMLSFCNSDMPAASQGACM